VSAPLHIRLHRLALRGAYRLQLAWWFVARPRIEGSYVAVWHGARILMIRNSYRRLLSLPAGGIKRGEDPRTAAVRELREEAGIEARPADLVFAGVILNPSGYAEDHAHFFELRCDGEPAVRIDEREVVWAEFLLPEEAIAQGTARVVRRYLSGDASR
jgi:8-oxo-dGTP pyrophosphatase MutT (NUDIX family)